MIFLGIDPGVQGALARYDTSTNQVHTFDIPTVSAKRGKCARDVDVRSLCIFIDSICNIKFDIAVVEQVQSRPRQAGQFAFGVNYGRVLGAIESVGMEIRHVSAQKWKQGMGLRGQDKGVSVQLACELFPDNKQQFYGPRGAGLDGRAEAALIAYYGSKL